MMQMRIALLLLVVVAAGAGCSMRRAGAQSFDTAEQSSEMCTAFACER
jgi:septation ring formation regulator EzrA